MRLFKRNMTASAGLFLLLGLLFLRMGIPVHAAGSKTLRAGEQITLRAGSSSSTYQ